jgi:hypothetical protein
MCNRSTRADLACTPHQWYLGHLSLFVGRRSLVRLDRHEAVSPGVTRAAWSPVAAREPARCLHRCNHGLHTHRDCMYLLQYVLGSRDCVRQQGGVRRLPLSIPRSPDVDPHRVHRHRHENYGIGVPLFSISSSVSACVGSGSCPADTWCPSPGVHSAGAGRPQTLPSEGARSNVPPSLRTILSFYSKHASNS